MIPKKNNALDIITYISITLMIILVIVFIKYKFSYKNEHFSPPNSIIIKDNFYDITQADKSPIFSDTPNKLNNKLGASNLCIYKTNSTNTEVTDIECISSGEMQNALELPEFRKTTVCIDEECINLNDVYTLTGKKPFKLVNNSSERPTKLNKDRLDCMRYINNPGYTALSCKGSLIAKIIGGNGAVGIPTLTNNKCNTNNNNKFIMTPGVFTKSMARDADPTFGMHVSSTGEGGGISLVPVHD